MVELAELRVQSICAFGRALRCVDVEGGWLSCGCSRAGERWTTPKILWSLVGLLFSSLLFFFVVVVFASLHLIYPAPSPRLARAYAICSASSETLTHSLTHPFFFSLPSILLFPPINEQQPASARVKLFSRPQSSYHAMSYYNRPCTKYVLCSTSNSLHCCILYYIILINVVIH